MMARFRPVVLCTALVLGALALLSQTGDALATTVRINPADVAPQTADTGQPIERVQHRGGGRRASRGGGGRRAYRGGGGRRAYRGGGGRRAYRGGGRNRGYYRGGGRNRGYYRGGGRRYGYNRGRHGRRYGYRNGRYNNYYGGYWYAFPWWLGAGVAAGSYYDPYYYAEPAPRYSGGSCGYWSRRCRANWSRRSDFYGCLRYHGCR